MSVLLELTRELSPENLQEIRNNVFYQPNEPKELRGKFVRIGSVVLIAPTEGHTIETMRSQAPYHQQMVITCINNEATKDYLVQAIDQSKNSATEQPIDNKSARALGITDAGHFVHTPAPKNNGANLIFNSYSSAFERADHIGRQRTVEVARAILPNLNISGS